MGGWRTTWHRLYSKPYRVNGINIDLVLLALNTTVAGEGGCGGRGGVGRRAFPSTGVQHSTMIGFKARLIRTSNMGENAATYAGDLLPASKQRTGIHPQLVHLFNIFPFNTLPFEQVLSSTTCNCEMSHRVILLLIHPVLTLVALALAESTLPIIYGVMLVHKVVGWTPWGLTATAAAAVGGGGANSSNSESFCQARG